MKIVFTGGGTGGHFYPIISIVEEIRQISLEEKLIDPQIYFLAPSPYNKGVLFDNDIIYKRIFAGKIRRYFSIMNFFDLFKTFFGILKSIWTVFWIYPDIIVSKGGYGSFPVVLAGRIFGIPILIHESDSKPGRVNSWAGKFADKIAVSYPDAANYFKEASKKGLIAWTGNPIRNGIENPVKEGAHEYLDLDPAVKVILVLGGSQGAKNINNSILDILPSLVKKYQIIHQTGKANFDEVKKTSNLILQNSPYKERYKAFDYLDDLAMRMSAGAANLVVSRAGSTIFEIANWQIPSIIIPIPTSVSHDQRLNAYNYARSKASVVIEEDNLTPEIFENEIDRILTDSKVQEEMKAGAKSFAKPKADRTIAKEIISTILEHEK